MIDMKIMEEDGRCSSSSIKHLPPGFRFCPTDEELVLQFLYPKALLLPCQYPNILPQLDLHQLLPWELHGKALLSGNQYFFFSRKTGNGVSSRGMNGYWQELDMEQPIFNGAAGSGTKVGIKKFFVFYVGEEAPLAIQTNWLMQEYRLCDHQTKGNNTLANCGGTWALCRVQEGSNNKENCKSYSDEDDGTELSCLDEIFLSLDDDDDEDLDDINSSKLF